MEFKSIEDIVRNGRPSFVIIGGGLGIITTTSIYALKNRIKLSKKEQKNFI